MVQTFSENYLRAYIVFISRKLLNGGGLLATWPLPPGGTIGTIFDSAIIFTPRFDTIEGGDVTVGIGVPPIHLHALYHF